MALEKELSKRIISEFLTYLYSHEITEIRIGLESTPEGLYIEIQGTCYSPPSDLHELTEMLNEPRNPTMDLYYQELGNVFLDQSDFRLLGSLIDDVELMYELPILNIKVFRRIL